MEEKELKLIKTISGEMAIGYINADGDIEDPYLLIIPINWEQILQGGRFDGKIFPFPWTFPIKAKGTKIFKDKILSMSDVDEDLKQLYIKAEQTFVNPSPIAQVRKPKIVIPK